MVHTSGCRGSGEHQNAVLLKSPPGRYLSV